MPREPVDTGIPHMLMNMGVPTYVHTINSLSELKSLPDAGVTEIYTDVLIPR